MQINKMFSIINLIKIFVISLQLQKSIKTKLFITSIRKTYMTLLGGLLVRLYLI